MPSAALGTGWVPVASVPMKLPRMTTPVALETVTPLPPLPEITFRAQASHRQWYSAARW